MAFYFTSKEHQARFLATMHEIHKIDNGKLDPEYAAAVYILTSRAGTWERAQPYVSSGGIEFEELLSEVDWSGGYSSLLNLAANLFNDRYPCNPCDVVTRLDHENFTIALNAMQIRRVSWGESQFYYNP
jgi:hypothetical protein